ncbi:hypothetical protein BDF22DRAFT_683645 [Syncephalis plumigaleata]|nr:hypothetical protein BDF22DRAFT_683645 [Syncephalis plumigaleata]
MTDTILSGDTGTLGPLEVDATDEDLFRSSSDTGHPYISSMTSAPSKNVYCCSLDRAIHAPGITLVITAANKTVDAGGSTFIAYCIRFGNLEVRRRYSEFASLRKILGRMYPTAVIPPIPEKHSLADYAAKQSRAKEDIRIIEKRKRMLTSFLNRLVTHPILSTEHVFHQFLNADEDWSSVLKSEAITSLPKRPIQRPPRPAGNSASNTPDREYTIPVPRGVAKLKHPDPIFEELESKSDNFAKHLQQHIDPSQHKISRKLQELAADNAELGALYNGFSLTETDDLALAIEKVGQAIDTAYLSDGVLAISMDSEVGERLHEYVQFAASIKTTLKYRHQRHQQLEFLKAQLEKARGQLATLLRADEEARRLSEAIAQREAMAAQAAQQKSQQEEEEERRRRQAALHAEDNAAVSDELSSGEEEEEEDDDDENEEADDHQRHLLNNNEPNREQISSELHSIFGSPTDNTSGGGGSGGGIHAFSSDGLVAEESWSVPSSRAPTFNPALVGSFGQSNFGNTNHKRVDLLRPPILVEEVDDESSTGVAQPPHSYPARLSQSMNMTNDSNDLSERNSAIQRRSSLPSDGTTASVGGTVITTASSSGGGGLFSLISDTFHGLLDVDPEATRRSNIGKTQQLIAMLEDCVETAGNELVRTSAAVQQELERCQRRKIQDFRDIMLNYARMQSKWCHKNLAAWEEARQAIDHIPTPLP